MNDLATARIAEWTADAQQIVAPEHVEKILRDSVEETRDIVRSTQKHVEEVTSEFKETLDEMHEVTKRINEKFVRNCATNSDAVLGLWSDLTAARDWRQSSRIQREFWEQQYKAWWRQSSELTGLMGRLSLAPVIYTCRATSRELSKHASR